MPHVHYTSFFQVESAPVEAAQTTAAKCQAKSVTNKLDWNSALQFAAIKLKRARANSSIFDQPSINAEDENGVWLTAERDQVLGAFRDADLSRRPF